ncbi:hypothetical protein JTB14_037879 [Gonioctena quinquepunctata]|nr:hypothetical protein JTB14_037879 [Gonioctena quinquepunctata]
MAGDVQDKVPPDLGKSNEPEISTGGIEGLPAPNEDAQDEETKSEQGKLKDEFQNRKQMFNFQEKAGNNEENQQIPASPITPYSDCRSQLEDTPPKQLKANFQIGRQDQSSSQEPSDIEPSIKSILTNLVTNIETDDLIYQLDDKNVVHPLGPSEAENAAEEGGPGHDTSNNSSASLKSDKNDKRLEKKVLAKTINKNNNAQGSKNVFAKPKLMRRRSRIERAPEDGNKSTTSDSRYQSSEIEEVKDQEVKTNKRKRNSPQQWEEKTRHREEMQKQKISSSNKQCECGGTMENHKFLYSIDGTAQKIKCTGSIRMKEIEYACELINEVDYEK